MSDHPGGRSALSWFHWVTIGGAVAAVVVAVGVIGAIVDDDPAGRVGVDAGATATVEQPLAPEPDPTVESAATTEPDPSPTPRPAATVTTLPSTPTPTTTTQAPAEAALIDEAHDLLARLEIVAVLEAPVPYVRDAYDGDGWADADRDCRNTRHEVLAAESVTPAAGDCTITTGSWVDPWSGAELSSPGEATIDHLVALAHAHRAGAWQWDPTTKTAFANDLDELGTLNVVSNETNQSKGDQAPDTWKPQQRSAWCGYAIAWIRVKARWDLPATRPEADALTEMLDTCNDPDSTGPTAELLGTTTTPATVIIAPPTPSPTPTPVPNQGPATAIVSACDRYAERVTLANPGGEPITLTGWRLHDENDNHSFNLSGLTIPGGGTLIVLSGPDNTASAANEVLWTHQHVWNNDGDTAFLWDPGGNEVNSRSCA